MIDLEQRFEQAWGGEPLLPDPTHRLAAGRRRLRRRRVVTSTLGSVAVVAVVAAGSALAGGGVSRSAEPGFSSHSTDPPTSSPSTPSTPPSLDDEYEVRAWPDPGVPELALWNDDHHVYRTAGSVHVDQRDGLTIRDASTGEKVGDAIYLQTTWKGRTDITYFDEVGGRILESGDVPGDWASVLDEGDLRPAYYHHFAGGFELFTDPVGLNPDGTLLAKTGATIVSSRTAQDGEYSTSRFDSGPPQVAEVRIAGSKYYAIAGYRSQAKDVIWSERADGRTLEDFLSEIKQRMDEGSLQG